MASSSSAELIELVPWPISSLLASSAEMPRLEASSWRLRPSFSCRAVREQRVRNQDREAGAQAGICAGRLRHLMPTQPPSHPLPLSPQTHIILQYKPLGVNVGPLQAAEHSSKGAFPGPFWEGLIYIFVVFNGLLLINKNTLMIRNVHINHPC